MIMFQCNTATVENNRATGMFSQKEIPSKFYSAGLGEEILDEVYKSAPASSELQIPYSSN